MDWKSSMIFKPHDAQIQRLGFHITLRKHIPDLLLKPRLLHALHGDHVPHCVNMTRLFCSKASGGARGAPLPALCITGPTT